MTHPSLQNGLKKMKITGWPEKKIVCMFWCACVAFVLYFVFSWFHVLDRVDVSFGGWILMYQ
jgi:hypothetical protein